MTDAAAPNLRPSRVLARIDWRKVGLGAAATAVNLVLVTALSYATLGVRSDERIAEPPLIWLDIEPRPLLPDERPRQPAAARNANEAAAAARAQARDGSARPSLRDEDEKDDRPAPVRPREAAPAPAGVAVPPGSAWRVDPADNRAAMARALRQGAIGCASPALLTEAERGRCREQFGQRAATAAPITGSGNPERDAAFAREAARRLAQWEQRNRPLGPGVGVVKPADCVGSNFGTGCAGAHLPSVPGVDMHQGGETVLNRGERRDTAP